MSKITSIEINFPVPVELPAGFEGALSALVAMVCEKYKAEHHGRTMWPAGSGAKPCWSRRDAAFLGEKPGPNAPHSGEPTFDDSIFVIEVAEREDYRVTRANGPKGN